MLDRTFRVSGLSRSTPLQRRSLVAAMILLGVASPISSFAAESPAPDKTSAAEPVPEDIVVTALKSGQNVRTAPVTVNVQTGEQLQKLSITSVEQLTMALPGVRIQQAPQGVINTTVRGLGSSPSSNTFDQTVGFFVDGIYAGHGREYAAALFDVDRIELLKGTQSAVVGKATSVGALALVTKRPAFEDSGQLSAYREFNLGTTTLNGVANIKLSDSFAVRIAGLSSDEGGWIHNELTDQEWPRTRRDAVRLSARYRPNDQFDWTVYGQYSKIRMDGQYFRYGLDATPTGLAAATAAFRGDRNFSVAPFEIRSSPRSGDANNPLFNFYGLTNPGQRQRMGRAFSSAAYSTDAFTVTALTGYTQYTDYNVIDGLGLAQMPRAAGSHEHDNQFSQELRIATNSDGPLSAVGGIYYWHDKWTVRPFTDQTLSAATGATGNAIGAFTRGYRQKTDSKSAFGQVSWTPVEAFHLTGGLRYEHYQKSGAYDGVQILRNPVGSTLFLTQQVPFAPFNVSHSANFFDYSGQAQYFLQPNLNVYVSYATGSKGFGYQSSPTSGVPGNTRFIENPYFAPELSHTTEAGLKWSLGARGRFNLAAFETKIKNYQFAYRDGVSNSFKVRSDQIRSRGVEIGAAYQLLDSLSASLTATYADVDKTVPVVGSISTLPLAPKWSGIGELAYRRPIGSEFVFQTLATFEFRGRQYLTDVLSSPILSDAGRVRTDIRIGLEYEPRSTEVALIIRNLTDKKGLIYSYASSIVPGSIVADEMPRTIAVQVRTKF